MSSAAVVIGALRVNIGFEDSLASFIYAFAIFLCFVYVLSSK